MQLLGGGPEKLLTEHFKRLVEPHVMAKLSAHLSTLSTDRIKILYQHLSNLCRSLVAQPQVSATLIEAQIRRLVCDCPYGAAFDDLDLRAAHLVDTIKFVRQFL